MGSALWEFVHDGPFQGTIAHRLDLLFATIQAIYADHNATSRLARLTRQQFEHADGFACLWAKAAETRALLPVLSEIMEGVDSGSDRDGHRLAAAKALLGMYAVFADAGMFLTSAQADSALAFVETYFEHHAWLVRHALGQNRLLYNVVAKTHYLWHIAHMARWMNPRFIWAYDAESFMHLVVAASKACAAGSPITLVGNKVMENFSLCFELVADA